MTLEQVVLQLGIAAFLALLGFRIVVIVLKYNSKHDEARTKAIADGFLASTTSLNGLGNRVEDGFRADVESHGEMNESLGRIEGALQIPRSAKVVPIKSTSQPTGSIPIPTFKKD